MIGSVVVKSVKDKWLEGKGENATVKIVIRDAGLDNGLSPFGTEQLACNLTSCKAGRVGHSCRGPDLHHSFPFHG
jgi:hypothetical protein